MRTVTGSMHLVDADGTRLLLDCGLFQGHREDFYKVNSRFAFPPSSVDAVILSHAHLDHCGNLPTLVGQGFTGPIYCTAATRDLTGLVLRDSAKVQRQDASSVNDVRRKAGLSPVEPLYRDEDAERAIGRLRSVPYHHRFSIGPVTVTFYDAGHILGSAITLVQAGGRTLGFTGDLGRPGAPLLPDAEMLPPVDVLLTESTYGDRKHLPLAEGEERLAEVVRATVARGGRVLIPSFALGRAQDVAYALHRFRETNRIPGVATFVDSPMAVDATEIFRLHPESFDSELRSHLEQHDPFGFKQLRYVRSVEDSKAINMVDGPFIVIATSGMCEFGRILHHLRRHVGDPQSSLVFVSFQAEGTLGRRLADGISPVNILGETHAVRLQIHRLDAFSAHADRDELSAWVRKLPRAGHIYCVHGEEPQSSSLAAHLRSQGFTADVPERGQQIEV
ncbi:MAG TPA: MBL fold metallo-hydrolase [bacterium]|nr:MBL fold metallo-hydrolase [bacterium]